MQEMQAAGYADPMQMHGYHNPAGAMSFAESVQMQHYRMMQPQEDAYPFPAAGSDASADGHTKNHALEALAEALDRAEVDMLLGGRRNHAAAPPGRREPSLRGPRMGGALDADHGLQPLRHYDDTPASGGEVNFALQAAREALSAFDEPTRGCQGSSYLGHTQGTGPGTALGPEIFADHSQSAVHRHPADSPAVGAHGDMGPEAARASAEGAQRQRGVVSPLDPQPAPAGPGSAVPQLPEAPLEAPAHRAGTPDRPAVEHLELEAFGCSPSKEQDELDAELERMARREMEEDEVIDFTRHLPPKPPAAELARPPSFGAHAPATTAPAPAPRPKLPRKSRPEATERQRLERRDFLVDSVLNDELPSRSATPRKPRARSRSSSRGPTLPELRLRSLPPPEPQHLAQASAASKPVTPRHRPPAPQLLDFSAGTRAEVPCPPRGLKLAGLPAAHRLPEERPAASSLPRLGTMPKHGPDRPLRTSGSLSARSWRGKAAASIYA